jgi:hypothetical protein
MGDAGCLELMQAMNIVFTTAFILNDGHEIATRLAAGDDLMDIVRDVAVKRGVKDESHIERVQRVIRGWPPLHVELLKTAVQWALSKLDTDDRVTIRWRGDATHSETVTRLELRGHDLQIEFAHPPYQSVGA